MVPETEQVVVEADAGRELPNRDGWILALRVFDSVTCRKQTIA